MRHKPNKREGPPPFELTTEPALVVTRAIPSRAGFHQIHPATRTFMALRMAVNEELDNLKVFLAGVLPVLAPGGRLAIVSFHSLEDRLVKRAFADWSREGRICTLTRKPIRPADCEVQENARSRSAKLRVAEMRGDSGTAS